MTTKTRTVTKATGRYADLSPAQRAWVTRRKLRREANRKPAGRRKQRKA